RQRPDQPGANGGGPDWNRRSSCPYRMSAPPPQLNGELAFGNAQPMQICPDVLRCLRLMNAKPLDLTLEVAPKERFEVVEMRSRFAAEHEALAEFSNCLYWSSHTTAGFLDRSVSARLSAQHVSNYVEAFRTLFPEGAGYEHDQLDRRSDLDAEQRAVEPKN